MKTPAEGAKTAHFCSMCGPKFCWMPQDIRDITRENEKDVNEVRKEGMKEKAKEFVNIDFKYLSIMK